jgi:hypothetical protein
MTKKPTIPTELERALSPEGVQRKTLVAKQRVKGKDKVGMTFFMSPATHARMREIAFARQTSLQQIVAQAVDEWLAKEGEPPFEYKAQP